MEHNLKIKIGYAIDVKWGRKTFEIRKNDRNYQVGDTITFNVIGDNGEDLTNVINLPKYEITYVFYGGEYGLDKNYCVFSIKKCA